MDYNDSLSSASEPLLHVHFNPKYMAVAVASAIIAVPFLIISIIGILFLPFIPFVLITYYVVYMKRICYVTKSYIYLKQESPVLPFFPFLTNTIEKTIPLEKITDITISENFVQKWFHFATFNVETAGNNQTQAQGGAPDLSIVGVNANICRDIKRQIMELVSARSGMQNEYAMINQSSSDTTTSLLRDIRDSLQRLEAKKISNV